MGQCLSCCEDESSHPTQNGHTVSSSETKSTVQHPLETVPMTKYHQHPLPMAIPPGGGGVGMGGGPSGTERPAARNSCSGVSELDPLTAGTKPTLIGADKKPFNQYQKLPPIRDKKGASDTKRTSFSSSLSLTREVSETKINGLFEQYKDPDEDAISADGIERLCCDLDVKPEEFRVLVLAWKFDAETMCYFSRDEFVNGCKKLRVDSIRGIQSKFPDMLEEVRNKQTFRDFYKWTYKFGLDKEIGQRTLPLDMALSLWSLVFYQKPPFLLQRWLTFLQDHPTIRGVPKDTWDMFLNFVEAVGDDLSTYDDTEAWPSLFDDFVEYENDRQNQNVKVDKCGLGYGE